MPCQAGCIPIHSKPQKQRGWSSVLPGGHFIHVLPRSSGELKSRRWQGRQRTNPSPGAQGSSTSQSRASPGSDSLAPLPPSPCLATLFLAHRSWGLDVTPA